MRRKIKVTINNLTTSETSMQECMAIVNKKKISYQNNDGIEQLQLNDKDIIIKRENNESINVMEFKNGQKTIAYYTLKSNNITFEINILTMSLIKETESIYIKYNVIDSNNSYEYILEMR